MKNTLLVWLLTISLLWECNVLPKAVVYNCESKKLIERDFSALGKSTHTSIKGKMSKDVDFFYHWQGWQTTVRSWNLSGTELYQGNMVNDVFKSETVNTVNEKVQSTPSVLTKEQILEEYSDVLEGLGCMQGPCRLEVDETVWPVVHSHRKVPVALRDLLKEELDKLLLSCSALFMDACVLIRVFMEEKLRYKRITSLKSIFKNSLLSAPKRLPIMMLQLQKYNLWIVYKPGKELLIADTLSRTLLPNEPTPEKTTCDVYVVTQEEYLIKFT